MHEVPATMGLKTDAVRQVVSLCRGLGRDRLLVQAGGGNVSVKSGTHAMVIKASGLRMSEVNRSQGWARADVGMLTSGMSRIGRMRSAAGRDRAYTRLLGKAGRTVGRRISMEAGFHALLPDTCVAHVHSIAGIVLGMQGKRRGSAELHKALGDKVNFYWVGPEVPGADLTLTMRRLLRPSAVPSLWVLENHGLVWTADSPRAISSASRRFEEYFRAKFGIRREPPPHRHRRPADGWHELCLCHWKDCSFKLRPLFPDFLIYFPTGTIRITSQESVEVFAEDPAALRQRTEIFLAHARAYTAARRAGRLRTMPRAVGRALARLRSEKLRVRQGRSRP